MGEPPWWQSYFDGDFVRFYAPLLPAERTRAEVEAIIELLALPTGARVLDLGCGWGRHAIELAAAGLQVTAVDQSATLLRHGRGLAQERGTTVEWVQGDMREPSWEGQFDAVLSLFSSLGYSPSARDDLRTLRAARTALSPGGAFLLETMHRDNVVREFAERDWWEGEGGEHVWVEREFDAVAGISREWLRWHDPGSGRGGEKFHQIRVRSGSEWRRLLRRAGLEPLAWYGGWDLHPFTHTSDSLIVVCGPRSADRDPV